MEQLRTVYEQVLNQDYEWKTLQDRLHVLSGIRRHQLALEMSHQFALTRVRDSLENTYLNLQTALDNLEENMGASNM